MVIVKKQQVYTEKMKRKKRLVKNNWRRGRQTGGKSDVLIGYT